MKKTFILLVSMILVSCQQKEKTNSPELTQDTTTLELLNSQEFATHIENKNVQLIDVRMKSEFEQGHIKGAKHHHIYDKDFAEQVSYLDKEKPVYLYCKAGSRSEEAALQLKEMGFKKIYDLKGGISSWQSELE